MLQRKKDAMGYSLSSSISEDPGHNTKLNKTKNYVPAIYRGTEADHGLF